MSSSWPLPSSAPRKGSDKLETVGIAQGQFSVQDILANFRKQKLKATLVRTNKVYPLAKTGMVVCFVDPSTMVFGDSDAVSKALDARDGISPSLLTNGPMMDAMKTVDSEPLWSILDQKGTQTMMKQMLGEAGSLTDFETVRKHLQASWYSMNFQHGVKFDLTISTGDSFAAATLSSLLTAGVDAAQDERHGRGETGADRHHHRLRRRTADGSLRHHAMRSSAACCNPRSSGAWCARSSSVFSIHGSAGDASPDIVLAAVPFAHKLDSLKP